MTNTRRPTTLLSSPGRVVGAIVVLIVAAFTATGFIAVRTLEAELVDRLDSQLADEALTTRAIIESLTGDELTRLDEASPPSSTTALIVLDASGKVIHTEPVERSGHRELAPRVSGGTVEGRQGPFTVTDRSIDYRVVAVPTSTGLTVVVAAPLDELHNTVATLAGRVALVSAVAFAALAVLVWLVISNANRQIDQLVDSAARIGRGDLGTRVEPTGRGTAGRLSHALNDMTAELQAAFTAREESEGRLRRFAADASHELRTPLTHIRGYAELLRSGRAPTEEDRARAARRIEAEARRMTDLVEDLLLLARLDQDRPLRSDPVELNALLADCVHDASSADPTRHLSADLPAEAVIVTGDEARLRQVMANLLANVRVHTPAGTTATVTLERNDGHATIVVDDDGPGMTDDAASHAFDRFYRSESSRSRTTSSGGSGLGLAIVRSIVTAHRGTVSLRTGPGQGLATIIILPLRRDADFPSPRGDRNP